MFGGGVGLPQGEFTSVPVGVEVRRCEEAAADEGDVVRVDRCEAADEDVASRGVTDLLACRVDGIVRHYELIVGDFDGEARGEGES